MNAPTSGRLRYRVLAIVLSAGALGCPPIIGAFQWARTDGGLDPDMATGVAPRPGGGAYVCGQFTGTAVFGAGQANETTLTAAGGPYDKDLYVARYDDSGALDWVTSAGGPQDDCAADIVQLFDSTIVVTGYFHNVATFGAGEANETRLFAGSEFDQDAFVARFTNDGALLWARREGGLGENDAGTVSSDFPDGSFVVAGTFEDRAVFDTGTLPPTVLNAGGPYDSNIFLARYERDGDLVWVSGAGGPAPDVAPGLTTAPGGGIFMTGTFEDYAEFGVPAVQAPLRVNAYSSIDRDVFIARYHGDGTVDWVRKATGIDIDDGLAVAAFLDGSVVVTGSFTDTILFAPDTADEIRLTAETILDRDAFVARYDRDGNLEWVRHAQGIDDDEAIAVAVIMGGDCIVAGTFTTTITLGAGEANETTLTADSEFDRNIFVARYSGDGHLRAAARVPAISTALDAGVVPGGDVLVAGWLAGRATLRDTAGVTIPIASAGAKDAFLARMDF